MLRPDDLVLFGLYRFSLKPPELLPDTGGAAVCCVAGTDECVLILHAAAQISGSLEPIERTTQDIKSKFLSGGLLTDGWTQQVGTHPEDRK